MTKERWYTHKPIYETTAGKREIKKKKKKKSYKI